MSNRRFAVIEAPSTLGLAAGGVERLPQRLLELGLADRIGARRAGRLNIPSKDPTPDPDTLTLNAPAIAAWSPLLADAVEAVLDAGEFPVVLGGDCTIVLGSMLALRRRGRYGLLFIDGNADFFQPEAEPNGEGASMDLAFVTGHGPPLLTDLEGRRPLVRAEDSVAFAFRDHEDQAEFGSQPLPAALRSYDLPAIRHRPPPGNPELDGRGAVTGQRLRRFGVRCRSTRDHRYPPKGPRAWSTRSVGAVSRDLGRPSTRSTVVFAGRLGSRRGCPAFATYRGGRELSVRRGEIDRRGRRPGHEVAPRTRYPNHDQQGS